MAAIQSVDSCDETREEATGWLRLRAHWDPERRVRRKGCADVPSARRPRLG